jgi:hypothetical protein
VTITVLTTARQQITLQPPAISAREATGRLAPSPPE